MKPYIEDLNNTLESHFGRLNSKRLLRRFSYANNRMTLEDQAIFAKLMKRFTTYPPHQQYKKQFYHERSRKAWGSWNRKEFKNG